MLNRPKPIEGGGDWYHTIVYLIYPFIHQHRKRYYEPVWTQTAEFTSKAHDWCYLPVPKTMCAQMSIVCSKKWQSKECKVWCKHKNSIKLTLSMIAHWTS